MLSIASKDEIVKNFDPLRAFEKIRQTHSFILYSGKNGGYSIIGYNPLIIAELKGKHLKLQKAADAAGNYIELGVTDLEKPERGLHILKNIFSTLTPSQKLPLPLVSPGIYGFLSYDFGVTFEGVKQTVKDDLSCPYFYFSLPTKIAVYDHKHNLLTKIALGEDENLAQTFLIELENELNTESINKLNAAAKNESLTAASSKKPDIKSNLTYKDYEKKFNKIKKYLKKGETYQVNFSQRFHVKSKLDPFETFKKVSEINPSPFQAYFETDTFEISSNSPERLVCIYDKKDKSGGKIVSVRPIKGTMPKGKTKKDDDRFKKQLLASKKDNAELSMIVDLLRNDIGKVCKGGTIKVTEHRTIESYSHLHHTVSNIEGELEDGKDFVDVIKATLPGGSITGCPKKRTIEIIDEMEQYSRGVYCGSAGYITFYGNMDLNIMIRTQFFKDGNIYFHSGGGIVIDSKAKNEYKETQTKAKALMQSLQ